MAVFACEPGITARCVLMFYLALLPGSLLVSLSPLSFSDYAIELSVLLNMLFGFLLGLAIRGWRERKPRGDSTSPQ